MHKMKRTPDCIEWIMLLFTWNCSSDRFTGVNWSNTFLLMLRFGSIHVEIGVLHGKGKVYGKSKCYAFFGSGQVMLRRWWQRHYFRRLLDRGGLLWNVRNLKCHEISISPSFVLPTSQEFPMLSLVLLVSQSRRFFPSDIWTGSEKNVT